MNNFQLSALKGTSVAAPTTVTAGQGCLHPVPSHKNMNSLFLSLLSGSFFTKDCCVLLTIISV